MRANFCRGARLTSVLLAGGLLAALPAGCSNKESADPWAGLPGKRVLVSFPPLYCFAANVAGGDAAVLAMMSDVGPHTYEGTERDARLLQGADVFFINGLGLEDDLARKLMAGTSNKSVKLVAVGEAVPKKDRLKGECHHQHKPGEQHDHGDDPHLWLGISHSVVLVEKIRDELKQLDPAHADGYERRAADYVATLRKIEADGKKLVSFHESLNYFSYTFDLEVVGVIESVPGTEPTADELAKIVELCKRQEVRLIAVEPQFPQNSSARVILDELKRHGIKDAAFVEIDPIETAPASELTPDLYERKMRANLDNLAKALR
jgi:zinc transport system substrate-binding protein